MSGFSDQDVPEDRRVFHLDATDWAELSAILNRPAQPSPALAELLSQAPPWDDVP